MKRPLPRSPKAELVEEAINLLQRQFPVPRHAIEHVLDRFTGWDLEDLLAELKRRQVHEDLKEGK